MTTAVSTAPGPPSGGEEARSFLQERLAFFSRTLLVILVGFYLAGNLAATAFHSFSLERWLLANWATKGANPAMLSCFALLAGIGPVLRAPRSPSALAQLDATVLLVTSSAFGSMALAPYVEDHPRDPVFRAAMAVMMTVIFRSVIVPSSSRRTLLLSFLAIPVPLALTALVYAREGGGAAQVAPHLVWTGSKPANVILVPEYGAAMDVAKVVDFGLVKDLEERGDLTQDQIAGTPLYLSPEAIKEPERVDARSDLYSLGVLGYYLAAGRPVFEGRNAVEICSHHLHTRPDPPSRKLGRPVPRKLEALLLDCLEKAPEARPASARELIARLAACDDVGTWTEDDARAWWLRHPPATSRSRAETRDAASLATLSVVSRRL